MNILILQHKYDDLLKQGALLARLVKHWAQQGHNIMLFAGLGHDLPEADVAIMHVDQTVVDDEYLEVLKQYPVVVNGGVKDISKTAFSQMILSVDDDYTGEVIIKTNANFGGISDYNLYLKEHRTSAAFNDDEPWESKQMLIRYPVFPSLADVPAGVWKNDRLIAEKYLPEQSDHGTYYLRIWIFFGDHEIHYRNESKEKVIKNLNLIGREMLDTQDVPEELREMRAKLGMDFGKFDYAIHNGKVVLYDINKSPSGGQGETSPQVEANMQHLSLGINSLIKQP